MKTILSLRTRTFRILGALLVVLSLFVFCLAFSACKTGGGAGGKHASVTDDFKTDYYVGEALVVSGSLKTFYDSTTFDLVPITEDMVSDFDTSLPGDVIVKVTYGDFVASVPIRVHPINAVSLTIDEGTFPTVVYEGNPFPSGATMTAVLSNGERTEHIPVTAQMLGGFDSSLLGEQIVTVGYLGASVSANITIKQDVRVSIALKNAKSNYAVGESLSVVGASLDVTFESGKVIPATLTSNLVFDFDTSLGGSFTAKVRYNSLECDYPYVVTKAARSIAFAQDSLPAIFEKGDPFPATGRATVVYDDGTSEVISLTTENIPAFTTATAGEKHVEVVVPGASDGYDYTVLPEITSATPYGYTAAVMQGTAFDGLGKLIVLYEEGEREEIPFRGDARLTVAYSTTEEGDIVQKATFRGREYPFTVHVYPESEVGAVDHIEVAGVFRTIKKGDPLDVTGLQVYIVYKYLAPELVDMQAAWASVDVPDDIDDYVVVPVTISCFGAEYESSVRVLSVEYAEKVTSVMALGFRSLYVVGEDLVTDGANLTVFYGGDYLVDSGVPVLASYVSDFSTQSVGEFEMTVTYDGYAVRVPYKVIDAADAARVTDIDVSGFAPLLFVGDSIADIDTEGYTITVTLGYGYGRDTVPLSAEMLSGGPFEVSGRQGITLTYQGVQKPLYVTVYPESDKTKITGISMQSNVTAYVGSQPDYSQAKLTVVYGYGYTQEEIPLTTSGVVVAPVQGDREGMVRTTVTYEGCACGLFVNFVSGEGSNVLQRVEVQEGSQTQFAVGDAFGGVKLVAYYMNGSTEAIDVTTEMAPGFDTQTAGSYSITISYGGKGAIYNYVVS